MALKERDELVQYILDTYQAGEKLAFLDVSRDFVINHLSTQGVDISPQDLTTVLNKVQDSFDCQESAFITSADLEDFITRTYDSIKG